MSVKLSICVTVKNRSRVCVAPQRVLTLFPDFIQSLDKAAKAVVGIELVVVDWNSDDLSVAAWLAQHVHNIPVRLVRESGRYFQRSYGLNLAAEQATGDALLFLDADILVPRALLIQSLKHTAAGRAFFPVCYGYFSEDPQKGDLAWAGFGLAALPRAIFEACGGWPTEEATVDIKAQVRDLKGWGPADRVFRDRVTQYWLPGESLEWRRRSPTTWIVREPVAGLVHQWHPVDLAWKNRYTKHGLVGTA